MTSCTTLECRGDEAAHMIVSRLVQAARGESHFGQPPKRNPRQCRGSSTGRSSTGGSSTGDPARVADTEGAVPMTKELVTMTTLIMNAPRTFEQGLAPTSELDGSADPEPQTTNRALPAGGHQSTGFDVQVFRPPAGHPTRYLRI